MTLEAVLLNSRLSLISSVIVVLIVFGAVGSYLYLTNPYDPSRIAVVVMAPGFGDSSLADQVLLGMESFLEEVSVSYYISVVANDDEAITTLTSLASRTGYFDLIVGVGHQMKHAIQTVCEQFPAQPFAIIGDSIPEDNVASAYFAIEEAAFLAGVLAAFLSNATGYTKIVGILGSIETDPQVLSMINGFTLGVQNANTTYDLNVKIAPPVYVGSYADNETAHDLAVDLFQNQNVSIIFAPVRASIWGVREAMFEMNQTWSDMHLNRKPLVIGAEGMQDQIGLPNPEIFSTVLGPSWVVTSVVPRTDLGIFNILNKTMWNQFPGGQSFHYRLANGGVNLTEFEVSSVLVAQLWPQWKTILKQYREHIIEFGLPPS